MSSSDAGDRREGEPSEPFQGFEGVEPFEPTPVARLSAALMELTEIGHRVREYGDDLEREVTSRMRSTDPAEIRIAHEHAVRIRDLMQSHDEPLQRVLSVIRTEAPEEALGTTGTQFCWNHTHQMRDMANDAQSLVTWLEQRLRALEDTD